MSRRALLWIAFAVVHVTVAVMGFRLQNQPMGDLDVYQIWAQWASAGVGTVGITEDWVYPVLALLPMLAVHAVAPVIGVGYEVGWAVLVTVLDAIAFAVLVGNARSRGRVRAAWFWLAFALLLGPVGMYRLDAITAPLAVLGLLWLARRPWVAASLLAVATWVKVWPAALLAAAVIAARARLRIIGAALAVSAVVALAVVAAGGARHLLGFVLEQTGRGLQVEAPISALYLWPAVAGRDGFAVFYDRDILTFQVDGPGIDAVIAAMTPVLIVAAAAVLGLGAYKAARGASFARLLPPLATALVLTLIVFNKVGSPQFLVWLIAPIALGLVLDRDRWSGRALAALLAAFLTFLVYPVLYAGVTGAQPLAVSVLTARNVLLIALLAWTVASLIHVPVRRAARAASPSPPRTAVRP